MKKCCANGELHVRAAKADLAHLARTAARKASQGHDIEKLKERITAAKGHVARAEEIAAEHECVAS